MPAESALVAVAAMMVFVSFAQARGLRRDSFTHDER
jgi:hypothetical protein